MDLSDRVSGHLRYPELVGEILRRCGFVGVRAAAADIEQDDVIRVKEHDAEGKPLDPDAPSASGGEKADDDEAAKEIRGLAMSSPEDTQRLPLPPRHNVANNSAATREPSRQTPRAAMQS